jgi:hypothetical protein
VGAGAGAGVAGRLAFGVVGAFPNCSGYSTIGLTKTFAPAKTIKVYKLIGGINGLVRFVPATFAQLRQILSK